MKKQMLWIFLIGITISTMFSSCKKDQALTNDTVTISDKVNKTASHCGYKQILAYNCNTNTYRIKGVTCNTLGGIAEKSYWIIQRNNITIQEVSLASDPNLRYDYYEFDLTNPQPGNYDVILLVRYIDIYGKEQFRYYFTGDTPLTILSAPSSTVAGTVPFLRYFNGVNHFYTGTWCELGTGFNGYTYQQVACNIYPTQVSGSQPFYRFVKSGKIFYTLNYNEAASTGYTYEGIAGYVFSTAVSGTIPLYRFNNPNKHFYTTNYNEGLIGGYNYEGIACWVK